MASEKLKVLLVDRNAERLAQLKRALATPDVEVVSEAGFGQVALTWARGVHPDIVVVSADEALLPAALATIERLAREAAPWTVVALLPAFELEVVRKVVLAGARDVVLEDWPPARLREALVGARRAEQARQEAERRGLFETAGTLVVVCGAKGGVGRTTLAANLAVGLAHHVPGNVALVDLDLPYGDAALMLDVVPDQSLLRAIDERILHDPERLQAQLVRGPEGVHLLPAPPPAIGPPSVDGELAGRLLRQLGLIYDFVVVDTPIGLAEVTAAALDAASFGLVVTTPEVASLHRSRALLQQLRLLGHLMDGVRLVLNRAGSRTQVGAAEVEGVLERHIDWTIANDHAALQAAAVGQPVVLAHPHSSVAHDLDALARDLGGVPAERRRGLRDWRSAAALLPRVAGAT